MINAITSYSSQIEAKIPHQIAFIYAFISQTSYVFGHSIVQVLSKSLTTVQILYFAGIQVCIINFFLIRQQGLSTYTKTPKVNRMLVFRAVFGFTGAVFINTGISYMPLSESIVLQQTAPVFTGILAFLFLGEKYNRTLVATTIFSFFGVILISKPEIIFGAGSDKEAAAYPNRGLGVLFTIIGGFITAMIQITLKKLGAVSNANTTGFYWAIGLSVGGPILQVTQGVKTFYFEAIIWLLMLGLSRYISQIYLHKGFTLGEANKVSLITYSQVPMAYIVDIFILGATVDMYSVLGSICVFSCVFVMLYQNYTDTKKRNAKLVA